MGERQLGTAAWILSKPVSRAAFVLAKLLSLAAGTVATITLLQGAVFSLLVAAATGTLLPPRPFLAGLALVQLSILFYLTLTLMLGVLFRSRGPVIGIPLAILLMQQIVRTVAPAAALVMPETLGFIGAALALGRPVPTYLPVAAVALCCALCTAVAIRRFGREEL